jgi:hypothetical protein
MLSPREIARIRDEIKRLEEAVRTATMAASENRSRLGSNRSRS